MSRQSQRGVRRKAGLELTLDLLYSTDEPAHRKFKQQFPAELERLAALLTDAHVTLEAAHREWPTGPQLLSTHLFLQASLNQLFTGAHFLVSGYRPAAGQQIRAHFESVAMAFLLLLDDQWKEFHADPSGFPAHRAVKRASSPAIAARITKLVRLDPKFWEPVGEAKAHYNNHSHGGVFSAFHSIKSTWPHGTIIGGEYDPGRKAEYRIDLKILIACAKHLPPITNAIQAYVRSKGQ